MMRIDESEVREVLRHRVLNERGSVKRWALSNGFTVAFVYMVLRGKKAPSARMCEALGIRKAVEYTLLSEAAE